MSNKLKKVALFAFVFAVMLVPTTYGQTADELQAQIDALNAQLAALSGGSTATDFTFTRDLTLGSTGQDVMELQEFLNANGALVASAGVGSPGNETTYFGSLTQSALANWQAANGISPAVGYFGPITRSAVNATGTTSTTVDVELCPNGNTLASNCSVAPGAADGTTCPNGHLLSNNCMAADAAADTTLSGGAGAINDTDYVSGLSNEEVGEAADDVEVAGLVIEADDGSDLELLAVNLNFSQGTADNDFEDYADEVSVWFDGTEVARLNGADFTDENNYDKTVTLETGSVISAGATGELVVAVSGINNLDSNDTGETWTLEFESIRFKDALGSVISDTSTGDINDGIGRTLSFETFATSEDIELKITEANNDAVNKAHLINLETSGKTSDVVLLDFWLEAKGNSDLEIREFGADFIVTGAADVDDMISGGTSPAADLELDGVIYGTASYHETAAANREILWDDVNFTIPAGTKVQGRILVDLLAISGDLDEGDTILAQITETQTDDTVLIDVRDETNEQLADADITGTATGEANEVYDVVFTLSNVSNWTATKNTGDAQANQDDSVDFDFSFDVTAVDGDVHIDLTCTEVVDGSEDDGSGFNFSVTNPGSNTTNCAYTSSGTSGTNAFLVTDGETETLDVTVNVGGTLDGDHFAQVIWQGLGWATTDIDADRIFTGVLDEDYQSSSVFLLDN